MTKEETSEKIARLIDANLNRLKEGIRVIENDVQKESITSELSRSSINDLIIANFSRAQESARVLEESFKLIDHTLSELFKEVRYGLYAVEKSFFMQKEEPKK